MLRAQKVRSSWARRRRRRRRAVGVVGKEGPGGVPGRLEDSRGATLPLDGEECEGRPGAHRNRAVEDEAENKETLYGHGIWSVVRNRWRGGEGVSPREE